jgi:hypothetical protein
VGEVVGDGVDVDVDLNDEKKEKSRGDREGVIVDPSVVIRGGGIVVGVS